METPDKEKYPLEKTEDLLRFEGGHVKDLMKFLEGSFFGIFVSGMARQKGWPRQILRTSKKGRWIVAFYMNTTGKKWSHFYTWLFKKDSEKKSVAVLYRKNCRDDGGQYFPIARCDLDDLGIIKNIEVSWCEEVIKVRMWEAETYGRPL